MNSSTKYSHLTIKEREIIFELNKIGCSQSAIARRVGVHRSTISRELKRGEVFVEEEIKTNKKYEPLTRTVTRYAPKLAQELADDNRLNSCKRFKLCEEKGYVAFIEKLVLSDKRRYSPDVANAIARRKKFKGVSTKTLYNWIEWGLLKIKPMDLLLKVRRKPRSKIKKQKRIYGKSILERPEKANNRTEFGHWEGDSIVGPEHKGQIINLVERKSRVTISFKFTKMRAENMVNVLKTLKSRHSEQFREIFKSITFDNGSEFAYNDKMSVYSDIYYARAYRSCDRASNENSNGIYRRFIPKKESFMNMLADELDRIAHWINTMPRKKFGYKTALEMFRLEVSNFTANAAA